MSHQNKQSLITSAVILASACFAVTGTLNIARGGALSQNNETWLPKQTSNESLAGIGAKLEKTNDKIVISTVFPGSPAEKAGLKIGQVITAINSIPTATMTVDDAVKLVRGPKGAQVELTVVGPSSAPTLQVAIIRDIITVPTPEATGQANKIGVAGSRPSVVSTYPRCGDTQVDPQLAEIKVTFSKEMRDKSWSWCTADEGKYPDGARNDEIRYLDDKKTCVLKVALKPKTAYAIWINASKFSNFRDTEGRSAVPYLLVFETK